MLFEKKFAIPLAFALKGLVAEAQNGPVPPFAQSLPQSRSAVGWAAVLQLVSARTRMSVESRACRRYALRNCDFDRPCTL